MRFENPLLVVGKIRYAGGEVLFRAWVSGGKHLVCSRCLEEFREDFRQEIFLSLDAAGGERVNALPELGEELISEEPIHALCGPGCRGLCPRCGANRNADPCACGS